MLVLTAVLGTAAACSDPVGPPALLVPELELLRFDDLTSRISVSGGGGILRINAFPVDTSFRLMPGQRVPVELTASSGDRESVGLYRRWCPARERSYAPFSCFDFHLGMEEGRHA
jgi:hypothetical protein